MLSLVHARDLCVFLVAVETKSIVINLVQ